jgi:hypothetical protein
MKTIIQQGDIYKLGEHIVGCGDALDAVFVNKVIGDKKIRAIISDPPYGVAYVEGKRDFNKLGVDTNKVIIGDQLQTDEAYSLFNRTWLEAVKPYLESYNACYIFNGDMMFCSASRNERSRILLQPNDYLDQESFRLGTKRLFTDV